MIDSGLLSRWPILAVMVIASLAMPACAVFGNFQPADLYTSAWVYGPLAIVLAGGVCWRRPLGRYGVCLGGLLACLFVASLILSLGIAPGFLTTGQSTDIQRFRHRIGCLPLLVHFTWQTERTSYLEEQLGPIAPKWTHWWPEMAYRDYYLKVPHRRVGELIGSDSLRREILESVTNPENWIRQHQSALVRCLLDHYESEPEAFEKALLKNHRLLLVERDPRLGIVKAAQITELLRQSLNCEQEHNISLINELASIEDWIMWIERQDP